MSSVLEQFAIHSTASAENRFSTRRHELAPTFHDDVTSYHGSSIAFGIILAGAVYPAVLFVICLVYVGVSVAWYSLTGVPIDFDLAFAPLVAFFYACIGGVIGAIWAAIVSIFTLPVVYLFVRSLKLRGNLTWLGAAAGGLVGFIAVLPMILGVPWLAPAGSAGTLLTALAFGPAITTVLGQIGGAWGARRAAWYGSAARWRAPLNAYHDSPMEPTDAGDVSPAAHEASEPHLQFRIHHLLWIFVWLSVLLSIIRLFGVPFEIMLPLLLGWLAYQAATLYLGSLIVKYWGPWYAHRRQSFHVKPLAN